MLKDPCNKCGDPFDFSCYLIDVSLVGVISGIVMIVGSVIAYIPQIVKLIKTKSTIGVSIWWLQIASYK
jgi:uncharacterized protein with PQ loop repeat